VESDGVINNLTSTTTETDVGAVEDGESRVEHGYGHIHLVPQ
jgi:hypothetical protein